MTQFKKDFVMHSIVEAAEKEFSEKGFSKASMRAIAAKANVTLSNIYNYFKNKDELFVAVLQPVLDVVEQGKTVLEEHEKCHDRIDLDGHHDFILPSVDYVFKYRDKFKLLANKAAGSSLANFKNDLIDWYVTKMSRQVSIGDNHHDFSEFGISEKIMRANAMSWIYCIEHTVNSDETLEQARKDILDMMTYTHGGWHCLIEYKYNQISKDKTAD